MTRLRAKTRAGGAFRQGRIALLLLLPSLVVVFGIIVYPLLRTLYISLFAVNSAFPGRYPFVGLGNYLQALESPEFWAAILRTAYFTSRSSSAYSWGCCSTSSSGADGCSGP